MIPLGVADRLLKTSAVWGGCVWSLTCLILKIKTENRKEAVKKKTLVSICHFYCFFFRFWKTGGALLLLFFFFTCLWLMTLMGFYRTLSVWLLTSVGHLEENFYLFKFPLTAHRIGFFQDAEKKAAAETSCRSIFNEKRRSLRLELLHTYSTSISCQYMSRHCLYLIWGRFKWTPAALSRHLLQPRFIEHKQAGSIREKRVLAKYLLLFDPIWFSALRVCISMTRGQCQNDGTCVPDEPSPDKTPAEEKRHRGLVG